MSNTSNRWKSQGGINRRPMNNILNNNKQSTNTLTIPQQLGVSNTTIEQYGDKRDMETSSLYKMTEGDHNFDNIIAYYPFNNLMNTNTNNNTNTNTQLPNNLVIKNMSLNKTLIQPNYFDLSLNDTSNDTSNQTDIYNVYVPNYSQNAIQFRNNSKALISTKPLNTINVLGQCENTEIISTILTFETFVYIPTGTGNFCIFALDDIDQNGLNKSTGLNQSTNHSPNCFYLWYNTELSSIQIYYYYNHINNPIKISNKNCGGITTDKWHKIMVVFGGSYIAIYIDGKETKRCATLGGSNIPYKPIAFNLGDNSQISTNNNVGPMMLDAEISLKANTKEFIEYLANPGNNHQYATSHIPNSNQNSLIYLLSNEFIGFNANLTCESDAIVNGELTTYGVTTVHAQSNFHDTAHFHGDVIFDTNVNLVYDSSLASHINIFSSPEYVNNNNNTRDNNNNDNKASLLIQNAGGLNDNISMPSMLVYNSNNIIQDTANTNNLVFSINGESVSVGPNYGENAFNVLGDSLFDGPVAIIGNLQTTGDVIHGGGSFTHDGTMYVSNLDVSGNINITGKLDVTNDATIQGITIGVGGGNNPTNSVFGQGALSDNTTGEFNCAVGYQAGSSNTAGNNNTYLGNYTTADANNYNNSTALGYKATITHSDQIVLGQTTDSMGNGNAPTVYIPGNVTIGLENQDSDYALDIMGGMNIDGSLNVTGTSHFSDTVTGKKSDSSSGNEFSTLDWVSDHIKNGLGGWKTIEEVDGSYNLSSMTNINKIGIGTGNDTPQSMLDVRGDLYISSDATIVGKGTIHDGLNLYGGLAVSGTSHFSDTVTGETSDNSNNGKEFTTVEWVRDYITTDNNIGGWKKNDDYIHNVNSGNVGIGTGTSRPTTTLDVSGSVNISNDLTVHTVTISGDAIVNNTLMVDNTLTVSKGGATIHGSMKVYDSITLENGSMYVDNGEMRVDGPTTLTGKVNIYDTTEISGNTVIRGSANAHKISIGTTDFLPEYVLYASGDVAILGDLTMTGEITMTGTIDMTGAVNIDGDSIHKGNYTHSGGVMTVNILDVSGNGKIGGQLDVTGSCHIGSRLDISGGLAVAGMSHFSEKVTGKTSDNSNNGKEFTTVEWVSGHIKDGLGGWKSSEVVDGSYNLSSTTNINKIGIGTGNDTPQSTLEVRGDLYISSDVIIKGKGTISEDLDISGGLAVSGASHFYDTVTGHTSSNSNNDKEFTTVEWVHNYITNDTNIGGWNKTLDDGIYYLSSNNDISNVGIGTGIDIPQSTLEVRGDLYISSDATISGLTVGRGSGNIDSNCVFGQSALHQNTSGENNTATGSHALSQNTTGGYNTATGSNALSQNTTGGYNTATGYLAGSENETGSYNTYIGHHANCSDSSYNYSTAIGYRAIITKSDQIVLGQITRSDIIAPTVYIPGNVGIGTDTLTSGYTLDVRGNVYVDGSLNITNGATIGGTSRFTKSVFGHTSKENDGKEFATLDWVNLKITNEGGGWSASILTSNLTDIYNTNPGNVGIGTTRPQSTLDVSGNITTNGKITFSDNISIQSNDNECSIAMGKVAGQNRQGANSIAIGSYTGNLDQSANSIAIGNNVIPSAEYEIRIGDTGNNVVIPGTLHVTGTSSLNKGLHISGRQYQYNGGGAQPIGVEYPVEQGTHIQWNRNGGSGYTYIMNQKGTGTGGISFGGISNNDLYNELLFMGNVLPSTANIYTSAGGINTNALKIYPSFRQGAGQGGVGWAAQTIGVNITPPDVSGKIYQLTNDGGGITGASAINFCADAESGGSDSAQFSIWTSPQQEIDGTTGTSPLLQRVSVCGNGNVGIGVKEPTEMLQVDGDALINGITIGTGKGNIVSNTALGKDVLKSNTLGYNNTAIGFQALHSNIGFIPNEEPTAGINNTAIGFQALYNNTGYDNTAIGFQALYNTDTSGNNNTAIGLAAGKTNVTGSLNTFLGYGADCSGNTDSDYSTAIGYNAKITKSNQIVLGETTSPPEVYIPGTLEVSGVCTMDQQSGFSSKNKINIIPIPNPLTTGYGNTSDINMWGTFTNTQGGGYEFDNNPRQTATIQSGYSNQLNSNYSTSNSASYKGSWGGEYLSFKVGNHDSDLSPNMANDSSMDKYTFSNISNVDLNNEVMRITAEGHVGIGTDSPTSTLDVNGNTTLKGALMVGDSTDTGESRYASLLHSDQPSGANDWHVLAFGKSDSMGNQGELGFHYSGDNATSNKLSLGFFGNQVMFIDNGGNVGIGTKSPTSTLDVNGNIYASGTGTIWANNSISCGSNNVGDDTGTITGRKLTDGTASMTGGNLSDVGTIGSGAITSTGTIKGNKLTDGTASMTGGALTGVTGITASGDLTLSIGSLITNNGNTTISNTELSYLYGVSSNIQGQLDAHGNAATNANNISTNANNISTNTNNISTNANNISTNANNISTNQQNLYQFSFADNNIGIGSDFTPKYPLHVKGTKAATVTTAGYAYQSWGTWWGHSNYGFWGGPVYDGKMGGISIFAEGAIATPTLIVYTGYSSSDLRIKSDITNISGDSSLEKIRLINPVSFSFKDKVNLDHKLQFGFIAQQVKDIIPHAVNYRNEIIPSIFKVGNVIGADYNIITINDFTIDDLYSDITDNITVYSTIVLKSNINDTEHVHITEIINKQTIKVDRNLSTLVDENNDIFVYGQIVDDFHLINKDTIWTMAVSALKEVDTQLQNTKQIIQEQDAKIQEQETKIQEQETKINSILQRLTNAGIE